MDKDKKMIDEKELQAHLDWIDNTINTIIANQKANLDQIAEYNKKLESIEKKLDEILCYVKTLGSTC